MHQRPQRSNTPKPAETAVSGQIEREWTPKVAESYCGIPARRLRRYAREGKIAHRYDEQSNRWYFRKTAIDDFMAGRPSADAPKPDLGKKHGE